MRLEQGLTVVAGAAGDPADVLVGGPVHSGGGRLGVVATASVVVPYWARPVDGSLHVAANLAALGLDGTRPAVRSLPERFDPAGRADAARGQATAWADETTLAGGLATPTGGWPSTAPADCR